MRLTSRRASDTAGRLLTTVGDFLGRITPQSYLRDQPVEAPWRDVLARWWPRLLPGLAATATHGIILRAAQRACDLLG